MLLLLLISPARDAMQVILAAAQLHSPMFETLSGVQLLLQAWRLSGRPLFAAHNAIPLMLPALALLSACTLLLIARLLYSSDPSLEQMASALCFADNGGRPRPSLDRCCM